MVILLSMCHSHRWRRAADLQRAAARPPCATHARYAREARDPPRGESGAESGRRAPPVIGGGFQLRIMLGGVPPTVAFASIVYWVVSSTIWGLTRADGDTTVPGLTLVPVTSVATVYELIARANAARATAATLMNEQSSRSHSVFTLRMQGRNEVTGQVRARYMARRQSLRVPWPRFGPARA